MIKFLDLHKVNDRFKAELQDKMIEVLNSGHFILGKEVENFEKEFAHYCGSKYCVGTASGLDALTLILKGYVALGKLKKGDEVIVPANTFYATVLSVIQAELKPILVEPNLETYNITAQGIKASITSNAKAIIAVHLYGQLADVESLKQLAEEEQLLLIEDAAQAHGAELNGIKAGNLSHASAFSFYPTKNLGCLGDGGAITTSDKELYNCLKSLRNYGSDKKYSYEFLGMNSRLDELQAAFLRVKLKYLDNDNAVRKAIAKKYLDNISNPKVKLPNNNQSNSHVYYVFTLRVEDRDNFITYLKNNKIESHVHYPIAPNEQKALSQLNALNLPVTKSIHKTIVSIPISPVMTNEEIQCVIDIINTY